MLDDQRTNYAIGYGDWVASATANFVAGQLVMLDASGNVVVAAPVAATTRILGVAKESKATAFYAAVVDEYIQLTGVVATNLAHTNLLQDAATTAGVRVATGTAGSGTVFTEGAGDDYVVSYANGTVTRTAGSTIVSASYVYVTYTYLFTAAELLRDGSNFWNKDDSVSQQNDKVTVIEGPAKIFTTAYDPAQLYAVNAILTASTAAEYASGYVTIGGTGTPVGRVIQSPTADDPFLGYELYAVGYTA